MNEVKREIHGVQTAYRKSGEGRPVVLLHGWGQNMLMMSAIEEHLSSFFTVYNLDFPGFGDSDKPSAVWDMREYEAFLDDFCRLNEIEHPILIGHSFGCRVAIRYAAEHPVYKMCLTGAAGIRPKLSFSQKMKTGLFKAGKKVLVAAHQEEMLKELQKNSGSEDYRALSGVMRESFSRIVNEDLTPLLPLVKCPVLLVWGEKDEAVPLAMGKEMERLMPDAGLAVFENDDHFAYWHQPARFNAVLDAFLREDMP